MSGEIRLVRGALKWGIIAAAPIAGIAFLARGREGAASALIASAIVLANAGTAALLSSAGGKLGAFGPAMISLPSFAVRMVMILSAMAILKDRPYIDEPTFALVFVVVVVAIIAWEARTWKQTPWIALTMNKENP